MSTEQAQVARIHCDYIDGRIDAYEMEAQLDTALRPYELMSPAQIKARVDEIERRNIASMLTHGVCSPNEARAAMGL